MKDIAASLGVSQTTVSHVLRGRAAEFRIGAATARRVRDTARRLHYQPSALARSLQHHHAYSIALAVGDLANPFWGGLAVAAQQEAERHGYMLVVNHTGESLAKERQLIEMLRQKRVDGLILSAAHLKKRDVAALREEKRPLVLVDREIEGLDVPSVVTDSFAGVKMAVDHLVGLGHRRIAYLGGPTDISTFRQRATAFRTVMRGHGLRAGSMGVSAATPEAAARAAAKLFKGVQPPTAILASNIWLTIGALRAAPPDVAVVGFDDIYFADVLCRPVTTIAQPLEELGRCAVELLLEVMRHPGSKRRVVLQPRLIVR
jgi:DNA-binding LacI/PurR family transcriptional regulator